MPFTPYNSSVQTSTTDYSPLQDFLKANNPAYANTQFAGSSSQPTQAPTQQPGLLESAGKDAFSTLLVKPAVRVGQAAAAPLVQEKMDSTTDIQQQQTDQLNKVIGLLKTETDPTKKAALHDMALNLVKQATANTQAGQEANANDAALSGNTHILGQDIQGQEGGVAGIKQIAGDALKSASYLAAPEALGATGEATSAGAKILTGAGTGAGIGALGGAGNELENSNSTTGSVVKAGLEGAGTGAIIGGVIPAAGEAFKGAQGMAEDFANKPQTPKTIKFTPEMQETHDSLTEAQQAFEDAKAKANAATTDRLQGVENSKAQVAQVQKMRDQGMTGAQIKTAIAQMNREAVTSQAVQGTTDIQSGAKTAEKNLGADFGKIPAQIEATDPSLRYNLSQKDLSELNAIKEDRKFALPDYLNQDNNPQPNIAGQNLDTSKMNPAVRAQIEKATGQMQGETAKALTPTQTTDLIRQINSKVYNPVTGEVDQRLIDLSNRIKSGAQSSFGHIIDENGESIWNKAYQNYSQGMGTIKDLKTVLGANPNKDLADISPNKLLEKINDLGKTPEGKAQLQNSIDAIKQSTGVDLTKPVKNVQQIADADARIEQAQKGASQTEKDLNSRVEEAQKNASQTTKSLVKNEIASREEVRARKADIAKAQAKIDELDKSKLTTTQKIAQLTKSKGLKWADYALRFIVIRELYKAMTAKPGG